MRANLTAPALATWLVIGAIICIVWPVPWYVGFGGGLAAAIAAYIFLIAMEPRWDSVPGWVGHGFNAIVYAVMAFWAYPQIEFFSGVFAAAAFVSLSDCVRVLRSPHQPTTPDA
ncbi:MAG: hypothetical protein R3C31_06955 [Hyphomonadaceae bacterium]